MDNKKKSKTIGIIIGMFLFLAVIGGIAYAWLTFTTNSVLIAGNTHCFTINYSKGADITGNIGAIKEEDYLTGNTIKLSTAMGFTPISMELDNRCNKVSGVGVLELNVQSLSTAFTSEGNSYGSLKYVVAEYDPSEYANPTIQYLKNQTFTYIRRGIVSGTGTMDIHTEYLNPGEKHNYLVILYIDKNVVGEDIIGASITATGTARADQFVPTEISKFNYVTDTYEGLNVPEGYVLLTEYTGTDTTVNVPATITINGTEYRTIILTDTDNNTSTFAGNTSITEVNFASGISFYEYDGGESFVENSADGLFSGCTSLETAPKLPDTITSMNSTYEGCTSLTSVEYMPGSLLTMDACFSGCSNLEGYIRISSNVVSGWENASDNPFYNTVKSITVEATTSSDTYNNFDGNLPANVTLEGIGQLILPYTPLSDFLYVIGQGNDQGDEITSIPIYAFADCVSGENSGTREADKVVYNYNVVYEEDLYLAEDEILLTGYTGTSTDINIPATYTVDGVEYNVVILSYLGTDFFGNGGSIANEIFYNPTNNVIASPLINNSNYNNKIIQLAGGAPIPGGGSETPGYECYEYGLLSQNQSVETIELDENISTLGLELDITWNNMYKAFFNDISLVSVSTLPSTAEEITAAFIGCESLTSAPTIPASVRLMGDAFNNCTSLTGTIRFNTCSFEGGKEGLGGWDVAYYGTVENITLEIPSDSDLVADLSNINSYLSEEFGNVSAVTYENNTCGGIISGGKK